jgi:hypothetical protein
MATKTITNNYKLHMANSFLSTIQTANSDFYFFIGDHTDKDASYIEDIVLSQYSLTTNVYNNMILGKKIGKNDANLMIRYIPYEANVVYDMYDDKDDSLYDKNFYVVTEEGANFHVFKCLNNNLGNPSTVTPEFAHIIGSNTAYYKTGDNYQWKYMYSVSNYVRSKYSSFEYFPIIANTTVQEYAVNGRIDVIKVEEGGKGYNNYTDGVFNNDDINYSGGQTSYRVSNNIASFTNGYYTGCVLYLISGTGAGSYRRIVDYNILSNGDKVLILETAFTNDEAPASGTSFWVRPEVKIFGKDLEINASAIALINSYSSNSVSSVLVLDGGSNYEFNSANVIANSVVGVKLNASLRPINSPAGGHGANALEELAADKLCVSVKITSTEGNTVPSSNKFQQIGILKNPIYREFDINYSAYTGSLIKGEKVYEISPLQIAANAQTNSTSSYIVSTLTNAVYDKQFLTGEWVYLTSSTGQLNKLTQVEEIVDSSTIKVTSNVGFTCNEIIISKANIQKSFGYFSGVTGSSVISLSNCYGEFSTDSMMIGNNSGAIFYVDNITINNVTKTPNTFVQLYKIEATVLNSSFIENEEVYIGDINNKTGYATVHSVSENGGYSSVYIYTSNNHGTFAIGSTLKGTTSHATATINNVYNPELIFNSGEILYLENIEPVTRTADEAENFRIIFNF